MYILTLYVSFVICFVMKKTQLFVSVFSYKRVIILVIMVFQERNFLARMIMALNISPTTINVGFTVYSSDIERHVGLVPFRPKIVLNAQAKMMDHPTGIATNTAKGIMKVRDTFRNQPASRSNAPKIMIVVTDGSSENPAETIRQAQLAKADGIRIVAVGVGNNVFEEELIEIATNIRKYYRAVDFAALQSIESDIRNMICRGIRKLATLYYQQSTIIKLYFTKCAH